MEEKIKELYDKLEDIKNNPSASLEDIKNIENEIDLLLEITNNYLNNLFNE